MHTTAFAIWLTGLPASGKSTLASALAPALRSREINTAVLESDELRRLLTPHPTYSDDEREHFYAALAYIARLLTDHRVSVIIDATGNRRVYRDRARQQIRHFVEVHVDCPRAVCMSRDPRGLYRRATPSLPGLNAPYEPPLHPEVVVRTDRQSVEQSVQDVLAALVRLHCLEGQPC